MACEREARLRRTNVFSVVVTDRELSVRSLFVTVVDDADIAATKNRTLVGVVGDCELGQI